MRKFFSTNNHPGLLLIAILLISGCNTNIEKSKSDLQSAYVRNIVGSHCDKAEENYNQMVKIDPTDKYPLRTYVSQNYKDMDKQIVKDVTEGAEYASKRLDEIQEHKDKYRNILNQDYYDYQHYDDVPEATEDLRKGLNSMEAYMYKDQKHISYKHLKTFVDFCKAGNKQQIPLKDLRKGLELNQKKGGFGHY